MNLACKILVVVNLLVTAWSCIHRWYSREQSAAHAPTYSYRGDDYPLELPFGLSDNGPVAMTLHETVRLPLNISDPVLQTKWEGLIMVPEGAGRVHLGPDHRLFTVVFWHQFHCLWSIQKALNDREDDRRANDGHVHHCLNYLRQTLLCQAVDTLELGDFMDRDFEHDRVGDTAACRDWVQVYAQLSENYRNWTEWAKEWD